MPVPDSGNCAALGYSLESGIPFEMAFVRNHYVGRSFLQPSQLIRDFDVRVKLNLIEELVKDKRVIVVDDSIVRGTTCKTRVNNLKEAGAKEVHVLVSCPPHMNPCVYGIDFPDRSKLMAANHSLEEIRKYLNADSLHYLSQEGMVKATGLPANSFCMACYDGNYPVPLRSGGGQAHHRAPQRPAGGLEQRRGPGKGADQAAVAGRLSASDLFSAPFASPSRNPSASPTVAIWSPLSQKRQKQHYTLCMRKDGRRYRLYVSAWFISNSPHAPRNPLPDR